MTLAPIYKTLAESLAALRADAAADVAGSTETGLEVNTTGTVAAALDPREPITQGNPVLVETGAVGVTNDWVCWTWCPACLAVHQWTVVQRPDDAGPHWGWNGDTSRPTFTGDPLEVSWGEPDDPDYYLCRVTLVGGVWDYDPACTHDLAGQQIPMVPVPDWLRDVT